MTELPFDDAIFDYVPSFNVIYHGDHETVTRAVSEIHRVLKPGGVYQGTMLSKRNGHYGLGDKISANTFVFDHDGTGDEAHPHYYCNARELVEPFAGFELRALRDVEHVHRRAGHWHRRPIADRDSQ